MLNEFKNSIDEYKNLTSDEVFNILNKLIEFPDVVISSCNKKEPHQITNYIYDLATLFHSFYAKEKIITDNELETTEKLNLLLAIQTVIQNALNLLGIIPREEM